MATWPPGHRQAHDLSNAGAAGFGSIYFGSREADPLITAVTVDL